MRRRRGTPYTNGQERKLDKSDFVLVRPVAEIADIWHARTGQRLTHSHIRTILITARRKLVEALRDTP